MSQHSPYIFTPATGKMRRDGIIRNIVRIFSENLYRTSQPEGRGRIIPGYDPQHSTTSGYHAPCYPQRTQKLNPAPVYRGNVTWNHDMRICGNTAFDAWRLSNQGRR